MSFSIEVPGEAVPLNYQDLCKALQAGTSHDHNQRQSATQQLDEWQGHHNFFSTLQNAYLDRGLPVDARMLAIIVLKNNVDRRWRNPPGSKGSAAADEKALFRSRLFQGTIDQTERQLALLNAILTAKIVRIDYPREWPQALSELLVILRSVQGGAQGTADATRLHGTLLLLLRISKELASARLRRSQSALQQTAEEMVFVLVNIYQQAVAVWTGLLTHGGQGDTATAEYTLKNSLLALKVLRHLVVSGFDNPARSTLAQQFWTLSCAHLQQFLGYVDIEAGTSNAAIPKDFQDVIDKHLLQLTKLHIDICEVHPASFALLPDSVKLCGVYWQIISRFADIFKLSSGLRQGGGGGGGVKAKVEGPLLEKLALKGLLLFKSCYRMTSMPTVTFKNRDEEMRKEQAQAKQLMEQQVFTPQFLVQMMEVIVTKLFMFRQSDMEAWDEDPEAWEAEESESGAAWEWQIRPCAEKLFLAILLKNKGLLMDPLLAYLQQAMSGSMDLLKKEAVYTAMGNAAVAINGQFNFSVFVTSTLVKDVQTQSELARVLRRRVALLLSSWAFQELTPEATQAVYAISAHLLDREDPANDVVVRLTAARQLQATVNTEFSAEAFAPHATAVLGSLMGLLAEVENEETKLVVLGALRVLIERMDTAAAQFSDSVVAALPAVWAAAGPETYMTKQAVLAILSSLMLALRESSKRYHEMMLPLIADAVDKQSPVHEHLFEEGLELWSSVLTMSTNPLPKGLVDLLPAVFPLLEYDSSVVETCLRIANSYIVLEPTTVVSDRFRRPLLNGLITAMDTGRTEYVQAAAAVVRHLIQVAHVLGGRGGLSVVVLQDMVQIGFLPRMLQQIHEAWEAHQTTGPKARASALGPTAEIQYFSILSSVAVVDPGVLVEAIIQGDSLENVWPWLMDEWFGIFETMGSSEHLKLACLGLTRLCELPAPVQGLVLARLQDYFSMWTSAVAEAQGGAGMLDVYVWDGGRPPPVPAEIATPLLASENSLAAQEAVHRERTYDFVLARLRGLVEACGGEQAFEENWAVNVDRDVLAGFRKLTDP